MTTKIPSHGKMGAITAEYALKAVQDDVKELGIPQVDLVDLHLQHTHLHLFFFFFEIVFAVMSPHTQIHNTQPTFTPFLTGGPCAHSPPGQNRRRKPSAVEGDGAGDDDELDKVYRPLKLQQGEWVSLLYLLQIDAIDMIQRVILFLVQVVVNITSVPISLQRSKSRVCSRLPRSGHLSTSATCP